MDERAGRVRPALFSCRAPAVADGVDWWGLSGADCSLKLGEGA